MVRHLPFPTILGLQFLLAVLATVFSVEFYFGLPGLSGIIALAILIFLTVSDVAFIILSLVVWWNVPLVIGSDGITKKGKSHRWGDAVSFTRKSVFHTHYGPMVLMVVVYSDGQSIRFESNKPIIKDIARMCTDKQFIALLEKADVF